MLRQSFDIFENQNHVRTKIHRFEVKSNQMSLENFLIVICDTRNTKIKNGVISSVRVERRKGDEEEDIKTHFA